MTVPPPQSVNLISRGDVITAVINLAISSFDLLALGSVSKTEGGFW